MSWIIRQAQETDAEQLFGYLLEAAGDANGVSREMLPFLADAERDYICHQLETANSNLLLAIQDADDIQHERVIGTVTVSGAPGRSDVKLTVSVHPAFHGHAIGLDLIRSAINWARLQGSIWQVRMQVDADSLGTLRLFERLGFHADGPGRVSYTCYGTTLEFPAVELSNEVYRAS